MAAGPSWMMRMFPIMAVVRKVGTNNFAVGVHNVTQSNWVRFSASSEARIHQLVLDVL